MAEVWTLLKVLKWTAEHLSAKGVDNGRLDAELLLCDLLALDRVGLYLNFDRPLLAAELSRFRELVRRRALREPLQYILGHTEFWSLPIQVNPAVLVPRADTEVLVEEALKRMPEESGRLLDVGIGSGCIALAILSEKSQWHAIGLDTSAEALQVASLNAEKNRLAERITLIQGDLQALPAGPWQLIVSNPPYIPQGDLAGLMPEVRDFEPQQALDGGADGLSAYRALSYQTERLATGGWLLVEVGAGQAEDVSQLFVAAGLTEVFIRADYAAIPRVVGGRKC